MVAKYLERKPPEERVNELLRQRTDSVRSHLHQAKIAARIKGYEDQYGIKSDAIHGAIERGQLKETQEVCRWIIDYDLLSRTETG